MKNVHRDSDSTMAVRWGTKFRWDVSSVVSGDVVDFIYFRDKFVVVTSEGEVCTIDGSGTMTAIWNDTIAGALAGNPDGWGNTFTSVDFTEFKNELTIHNGVDKPIIVSKTHVATYLQDIPTGSNVFTPTGKYATTVGNYLVVAGIEASPDEIYISSAGTSGTWPGDDAPNDSLSINIASYSAETGGDLRGLSSFRNFLIVHFATTSLVVVLGEYDDTTHKPRILDTLPDQGTISHRTICAADQDLIFADEQGVWKANRNAFGSALENKKLSNKIQTGYIADVPTNGVNRLASFAVYNKIEGEILFFLKGEDQYNIYNMTFDEGFKKVGWSFFCDMNFVAGASSTRGRVFLASGSRIYQYGNSVFEDEDFTADLIGNYDDEWATATAYVVGDKVLHEDETYICLEDHTSAIFDNDLTNQYWTLYQGEEIDFDWELPWTDTGKRAKKKRLSFIAIDTEGTATFTVEAFVDNIRYTAEEEDDPAISLEFVAGSSLGYGGGDQPYGGGRRAADERLWGFPCEFKLLKLRFKGSTTKRLKFSVITLLITMGTYKR